jgi:hypothetical protein
MMSVMDSQNLHSTRIPAREWMVVIAWLVLLFGFDLLTSGRYPTVWCDEVSFSEPAFNYLLHDSYTTTVWQFQPLNTFPAVNCPLYTFLMTGWLWVFGTHLLAVRAFNYFLMGVACLLFWQVLCRFNLVRSARWRLALVTALHLGYGISFSYRCSRPDTLGMVLTLALALLFTVQSFRLRNFGLFMVATVLPWVSFSSGLYAGFACFCCVITIRRPSFLQAMVVWVGLLLGVASVCGFLYSKGVLQAFVTGASHVVGNHYEVAGKATLLDRILHLLNTTWPNFLLEYSTTMLLMGILILAFLRWKELKVHADRRIIACSALTFASTPFAFNFIGYYAFYYSYTIFIPALILFASVALGPPSPNAESIAGRLTQIIAAAILTGTILVGLPMKLALSSYFARITPNTEIQRRIVSCINPDDVVYTADACFFDVKPLAKVVYARCSFMDFVGTRVPGRRLTQSEKDNVTKLVVRADTAAFFTDYFGGPWEAVTEPFGDTTRWDRVENLPWLQNKMRAYLDQPQTWRYQLQVFQRTSASPGQ